MTGLYRDFSSPDALDAEYFIPRTIPDHAAYGPRFLAASAPPLAAAGSRLGLRYGLTRDEYLDVFPPTRTAAAGQGAPVLVFIHGGYWRAFSARDFAFASIGPAAHGMVTVVPNYTLAPRAPMSEIVRQMRAAVFWVHRNIAGFGGDPSRVTVAGHSAGGHLAAMAALTDWTSYDLGTNPVGRVHGISGLYDLRPLPYTFAAPFLQLGIHDVAQLSPMLHDLPPALPPSVLSYGGAETAEFRRQSEDYAARLRQAGHQAATLALPQQNHLDAVLGLADPGSPLTRRIAADAAT